MDHGSGLMLRPTWGSAFFGSSRHWTKGVLLLLIFFTVGFGGCWFVLHGNQAIRFIATSGRETWTSFPFEACFLVMAPPFTILLASHGVLFCVSGAPSAAVSRARVIPADSDAPEFLRRLMFFAWFHRVFPLHP